MAKVKFARVPTGAETCSFCIMLASRGAVYANAKTAGESGHYHAHCDCMIVPVFDGKDKIEGYDPDYYYKLYKGTIKNRDYSNNSFFNSQTKLPSRPTEKKPERPKRRDFDSEEKYEIARNLYRKDREAYERRIDEWVENTLSAPRKYDTEEKLLAWSNSRGVEITKDALSNIDIRFLSDAAETYDEMIEKFPIVEKMYAKQPGKFKIDLMKVDGVEEWLEGSNGLNISKSSFSNYEDALRGYAYRSDTVYGDGTIKTVIRHEFGHNVDDAITLFRFFDGELENMLDSYFEYDIKASVERDYELRNIARTLGSEYSQANGAEAFAEGVAELVGNPNSEFAKAFKKFLDRDFSYL